MPVDRYGKERASWIYWGIGTHLGRPWPQNAKGHLLGDVTDQGKAADDPTSRGNEIGGIAFPFHSDGSDLVGLFCLDAGASGGASVVANVVTIHNDLVRDAPDLAAELYAPFPYDLRGEQAPDARPWYTMPIFNRCGDRLFVRYIRPYIEASRRHADTPRPSDRARAAMDRVDAMCADPRYHVAMMLEPGDMQFVNNYHVLHAREAYTDDRAAGKIRHLKRLWLETDALAERREARAVPARSDRLVLVTARPHEERAAGLTRRAPAAAVTPTVPPGQENFVCGRSSSSPSTTRSTRSLRKQTSPAIFWLSGSGCG